MPLLSTRLGFAVLSSLLISHRPFALIAQETPNEINVVLKATDATRFCRAIEALLQKKSIDELRTLKNHTCQTVAVAAAWEIARKSVRGREGGQSFRDARAAEVNRFIGFLEGRLEVCPPTWWVEAILGVEFDKNGNAHFQRSKRDYHKDMGDLRTADGCHFESCKNGFFLREGGEALFLEEEFVDSIIASGRTRIAVRFCESRAFIAVHSEDAGSYVMNCIDRKTGGIVWQSRIWAAGAPLAISGGGAGHAVELIPGKDVVLVFGASVDMFYVEAFDENTGQVVMRFSSSR